MNGWKDRAETLADRLAAGGALTDPAWRSALVNTPRHLFVPSFYALDEYNSPATLVDGADATQREGWLDAVYSDQVLVTQYGVVGKTDDGREIRAATSSASMPHAVMSMLERLEVHDGHRVLEIGTGTGYNAALLCQRLGADRVVSVDIDPTLVDVARERLARAGHRPTLAATDGAGGFPPAAPFDRILATCSVNDIPAPWIDQLAPAGKIVTPLQGGSAGALAVLTKTGEHEAVGRIDAYQVYFMPLRRAAGNPLRDGEFSAGIPPRSGLPHRGLTRVDPKLWDDWDFRLWIDLHLRGVQIAQTLDGDTPTAAVLWSGHDRADVSHQPLPDGLWPVEQYGHRRFWDTVETAWHAWHHTGQPDRTRLGITATTHHGQHIWLDAPHSPYSWPLPL